MAVNTKAEPLEEKTGSVMITVRGDETYKNTIKSEAARRGFKLGAYSRKLLEIARREVEKNPELLNEV